MFSRKELALAYGCCTVKLRQMLRKAGIKHRLMITPIEFGQFQLQNGPPRFPKELIGS